MDLEFIAYPYFLCMRWVTTTSAILIVPQHLVVFNCASMNSRLSRTVCEKKNDHLGHTTQTRKCRPPAWPLTVRWCHRHHASSTGPTEIVGGLVLQVLHDQIKSALHCPERRNTTSTAGVQTGLVHSALPGLGDVDPLPLSMRNFCRSQNCWSTMYGSGIVRLIR